jgi:TPR repeat protein
VHYVKLSADQGCAETQFNYGVALAIGDGIPIDKSHAPHFFKLAADQGDAAAQHTSGILLKR